MPARIIDGKAIAAEMRERVTRDAEQLAQEGRRPCLAAVLVGDDASSRMYAASQARSAQKVGIEHRLIELPGDSTAERVVAEVDSLNRDAAVSGILVYQPLPKNVAPAAIQQAISPAKDVEGVHPENLGRLSLGRDAMIPCTAAAVMACLRSTGIDLTGTEAVVVGRSPIVGKPVAMLLLAEHATVTQCHTRTRDLAAHCSRADVLIAAAGSPLLIGPQHVREGAIVIDVGTHRVPDSDAFAASAGGNAGGAAVPMKTVGDVRFDEVVNVAAHITPVPGGVGTVTVAMLWSNVVAAARRAS
ncbi:MAG: bifunctional 5,10-methylenetetrahydrofolate dehydrogenase/5,10-methenyltetrahydrofolate cyclohydrolase [Phycisphaerae bacterium]